MSEGTPPNNHLAVVPLAVVDDLAARAVDYAGSVAPQVVAVHVRNAARVRVHDFESAWAESAPGVPLLILDAAGQDWQGPFLRAVDALRRSAQADLVTIVLPRRTPVAGRGHGAHFAVLEGPGVAVTHVPPDS